MDGFARVSIVRLVFPSRGVRWSLVGAEFATVNHKMETTDFQNLISKNED